MNPSRFLRLSAALICVVLLATAVGGTPAKSKRTSSSAPATYQDASVRIAPGEVYVKLAEPPALSKAAPPLPPSLNQVFSKLRVSQVQSAFPEVFAYQTREARSLSRVMIVRFDADIDPREAAAQLSRLPEVEYAEPRYIYPLAVTPNDSLFPQQGHLAAVGLPQAWEQVKGEDGDVIIAVVDGGTDWEHEDLRANIWTNPGEVPGNGVDDDQNGFVDDVHGWNFPARNNDPDGLSNQTLNRQHGTHTAGIAAAVTNNGIGVAGASWNCTLMPINAASARSDTSIGFGYEGIVYAAANGADIISCSWGGKHSPSKLQQEVIDFAFAQGALVVAAAGNDGSSNDKQPHFPSNYNHVLSVGSIANFGRKSSFSNYGISVDVFAPGEFVLSTFPDNAYGHISGTSMSTPLVAGIAGLVKTLHPELTVDQLREQLRVTAQPLDALNPAFSGLMGKGKIQALAALTADSLPAVRLVSTRFTDASQNGLIEPGESITLLARFTNYLAPATDVQLTLTTDDPDVQIDQAGFQFPRIDPGDTLEAAFTFNIRRNLREGEILPFAVDISTANYHDRDLVELLANPPKVLDHTTEVLTTSITAQGNIGFTGFADSSPGKGFTFRGRNYLFEGGIMIGTDVQHVSDCIRGADGETQDDDFRAISLVSLIEPGNLADQEGEVVLVDSFATNPLGLEIAQKSYTYTSDPFNGFIIFKYIIENRRDAPLQNLWTGLFFDWDINSDAMDFARFDPRRNLGWAQDAKSNPGNLAGTRVLTAPGATSYRAVHNPDDIYGGPGRNGFTDSEKWHFLSDGIQRTSVDSNDVSTLTSTGPFDLAAGGKIEVAFAVIGGNSREEFFRNAELAQFLWDNGLIPQLSNRPAHTTTHVFQNPAASRYADIVVIADRSLKRAPAVSIAHGADTTQVAMERIVEEAEAYRGAYEFPGEGEYTIFTQSTALINGADTTQQRTFTVQVATGAQKVTLSTFDGSGRLRLPAHALRDTTFLLADVLPVDGDTVIRFGPPRRLERPAVVEMALPESDRAGGRRPLRAIQRRIGDRWVTLQTVILPASGIARAQVQELGDFRLAKAENPGQVQLAPETYALRQNYPNPFNPQTIIEYDLPEDAEVELTVYNALGQMVRTLQSGPQIAGRHRLIWDATDASGRKVATGVYFYRLKTPAFTRVRKMIFMR